MPGDNFGASRQASDCQSALRQHERCDNTNAQEADNLNEHVAGGVNAGKAIPVPIGNVGGNGGKNSSSQNKADSAGEACYDGLSEKENDEDRFD